MSERARIVHVMDRLSRGGMESVALAVMASTQADFEHVVICLRDPGELAVRAAALGIEVQALHKRAGHDWRAYLALRSALARWAPALVQTYNVGTIDVAFWARLAGCRHVIHAEHGRAAADPDGRNRKYRWLRWVMAPLIDHVVAVSQDLATWLHRDVGVARDKIRVIGNGIDTECFTPALALRADRQLPVPVDGLASGTAVFCSIGRLDPVKGFATLIDAIARLRATRPELVFHLLIVGDGDERERLARQIASHDLGAHITLCGHREDTPALLAASDVYISSSVAEGMALAILEAMAAGLPVVATAVGGTPELVEPEATGLLVPARRADTMAEAIARLLDTPALATAMGQAGRKRVLASYSASAMVAAYRQLYEQCLRG